MQDFQNEDNEFILSVKQYSAKQFQYQQSLSSFQCSEYFFKSCCHSSHSNIYKNTLGSLYMLHSFLNMNKTQLLMSREKGIGPKMQTQ